jgi:hypothetical protein
MKYEAVTKLNDVLTGVMEFDANDQFDAIDKCLQFAWDTGMEVTTPIAK